MDNLIVQIENPPIGFFAYLCVKGGDDVVANYYKAFRSHNPGYIVVGSHPKGVHSPDEASAIALLKKNLTRIVKRLEANGDRRPSQDRTLAVYKAFLDGAKFKKVRVK